VLLLGLLSGKSEGGLAVEAELDWPNTKPQPDSRLPAKALASISKDWRTVIDLAVRAEPNL
jgi:hypothetical protein